jgi:hypothetical protein
MSETAQAIAESMYGVFGKKAEEVIIQDEKSGSGGIFFNPDAKSAPNQVYRCVIKFLPKLYDLENPEKTETVETVSYWIPEGTGGFRYSSPKSIGKNQDCIVANKFWEWKESTDARLKKLSAKLSYKRQFFSLIQVIEDQAKPENNGKIFIYDVPYSIQKKIKSLMYPSKDDIKLGAVANNIYDPLEGQVMIMKVSIKNTAEGEFRDYDDCAFSTNLSPRMIVDFENKDDLKQAAKPETPEELRAYQSKAIKTILAGPSLKDVEYKPATEETLTRIAKALSNLENGNTGDETNVAETTKAPVESSAETTKAPVESSAETTKSAVESSAEDLVKQVMASTAEQ